MFGLYKMKPVNFFLIYYLFLPQLYAQHAADSLEAALQKSDSDSGKIGIYTQLIHEYGTHDPGYAIELGKEVLPLLNAHGKPADWAVYNNGLGIAHNLMGEYVRAIDYFLNSLELFESIGDTIFVPRVMNNIGVIYHEIGNFEKASEYYSRCLVVYKRIGDRHAIAVITNNLGSVYEDMGKLDSALYFHNESLAIAVNNKFREREADSNLNVGSIYVRQGDYNKAISYLLKAFRLDLETENSSGIIETYALLGEAYLGLNRPRDAYLYLEKGLELSLEKGTKKLTSRLYNDIGTYYYLLENYKEAYEYKLRHVQLSDSIVNTEIRTQIADMQLQYENNRKEQAISLLTEINALKDSQIRSQKERSNFLLIIVLFLVMISGLLLIYYRIYSRANNLLGAKNRKISEQNHELEQQSRKLQELSIEKDNMISIVAHDLKSPLSKILGISGLLRHTGNISGEQKEYFTLMDKVISEANSLIGRILDLNKLESGEFGLKISRVNLRSVMEDVAEAFDKASLDKNIKINHSIVEDVECYTDRDMVYSILDNLLSNAIKFSEKDKSIFLGCRKNGSSAILSVKDEGPGINHDDKPRLFRKYSRLSATPTGGESSTGLGLAIVKLAVEKLKGEIEVRSESKKGSEFIVRLPMNHDDGSMKST
ncbi:MAG TPA: tetratricopeptide repeat protein [Cyclobacteriaceae bacterium]|nr:tetratricopeptide repeat protein [Cyclobacteriaceae bacterium]